MLDSSEKLNFSELNQELGGFGKFQKYVFLLGCIVTFVSALNVVNVIFVAKEVDHRCAIDECEFLNDTSYEQDFLNFTIPFKENGSSWSKCKRFQNREKEEDDTCHPSNFDPNVERNCSKFVYDNSVFTETIISEFGIVCSKSWLKPYATSAYMVGMLFGAFLLGGLADRIGRRRGLAVACIIASSGGILCSFSNNFYMFLVTKLITGIGGVAVFAIPFILVLEFAPPESRNLCGILIEIPFALGEASVALFAYFLRDWRWLQGSTSIPILFILSYLWIMPESIRWSVSQGRLEEARNTIQRVEKYNGVQISRRMHNLLESEQAKKDGGESFTAEKLNPLDLFRYPNLRKRTLILIFCWASVTLSYYGLSANSANLGGDVFVNFVAIMLIEIPSYVFAYIILDRIGRKWSLFTTYVMGGLGCVISGFLPSSMHVTIVAMSMIGKFGISAAFAIIFVYTAELFPTSMRSLGVGTCSTAARVGGIVAPFVSDLASISKSLPLFIFGLFGLMSGALTIFLPETYGYELPQTIKESENFGLDQKLLYMPCCNKSNKTEVSANKSN